MLSMRYSIGKKISRKNNVFWFNAGNYIVVIFCIFGFLPINGYKILQ